MKRLYKIFSIIFDVCICLSLFSLNTLAASGTATIACNTKYVKGDTVSVVVTIKAHNDDPQVWYSDGKLSYNPSVLKFSNISKGMANENSSGELTFSFVGNQAKSDSVTFTFTAIDNGKSTLSLSNCTYSNNDDYSVSGQSVSVTVSDPAPVSSAPPVSSKPVVSQTPTAPSSNCNLSSLSVDGGTLTPAFSPNVTEYSVTVENSVSSTVVHYSKAHSGATVSGGGTVALEIGDNAHAVTVTAQDGTKKTYNIKIRRATIEETVALNPFATVIGGKMHHIVNDLTGIEVPAGFVAANESYNGQEIPVFKSDNSEYDYTLFRISRDEDGYTDYYIYKSMRDEFVPLQYMIVNNIMYVFAELPETYIVPEGYYETATTLGNGTVKAFCAEDEALADLYVVYCYTAGNEGFYRFDALQSTVQRAPDFSVNPPEEPVEETGIMGFISSLTRLEKILILALAVSVIVIIILIIVLCIKGRRSRHGYNDPLDDDDMVDFFQTANMMSEPITEETENE